MPSSLPFYQWTVKSDDFILLHCFTLLISFSSKETVVITVIWFDSVYNITKQFRLFDRLQS